MTALDKLHEPDPYDMGTATYSPEDNKLRFYPLFRLSEEDYKRAKAAKFQWAPHQKLFYATWNPVAEDLLLEWCGSIEPEEMSLEDRAAQRAERFQVYSEKRAQESERAAAYADSIMSGIPLGQPILVGHHSEKRARKDAERIDNALRKAVNLWETSEYWQGRARAAQRHADYKNDTRTRARRLRGLESERRILINEYTPYEKAGKTLQKPWQCPVCRKALCSEHPEAETKVVHVWLGHRGRGGSWCPESSVPHIKARCARLLAHVEKRIAYEKAFLTEAGRADLAEPPKKARPTLPPILNYKTETVTVQDRWTRGKSSTLPMIETTKAEYARVHTDYKATNLVLDGSHRIRIVMGNAIGKGHGLYAVYLTDGPKHTKPEGGLL